MNPLKLTFTANEQALTKTDNFTDFASNTVSYIEATFTLGENWTGYDSVRAVWKTDYYTISTVLGANFTCIVPTEVLRYKAKVFVNLVGSIVENDTLTDRLTTFPVLALTVKANAAVNGSETAPVTPSQFEQFVETVQDAAGSISDYSYDSEAWAVGKRGGVDVPSTDETYHNNSKYWAEQNAGLSDEVADLKEDLIYTVIGDNVAQTKKIYDNIVNMKYSGHVSVNTLISQSDGTVSTVNGYASTDEYLPTGVGIIPLNGWEYALATYDSNGAFRNRSNFTDQIRWFDQGYKYKISFRRPNNIGTIGETDIHNFIVPAYDSDTKELTLKYGNITSSGEVTYVTTVVRSVSFIPKDITAIGVDDYSYRTAVAKYDKTTNAFISRTNYDRNVKVLDQENYRYILLFNHADDSAISTDEVEHIILSHNNSKLFAIGVIGSTGYMSSDPHTMVNMGYVPEDITGVSVKQCNYIIAIARYNKNSTNYASHADFIDRTVFDSSPYFNFDHNNYKYIVSVVTHNNVTILPRNYEEIVTWHYNYQQMQPFAFSTGISDMEKFLSGDGVQVAVDSDKGMVYFTYNAGSANYGEAYGHMQLGVFPIHQPYKAQLYDVAIAGQTYGDLSFTEMQDNNIILGNGIVRVLFYETVTECWWYRDFDIANKTFGNAHKVKIKFSANDSAVDFTKTNTKDYYDDNSLAWGGNPTIASRFFEKNNELYGCLMPTTGDSNPVFIKTSDYGQTFECINIIQITGAIECAIAYIDKWYIIIRRGGFFYSSDDFATVTRIGSNNCITCDGTRPDMFVLNNEVVVCVSKYRTLWSSSLHDASRTNIIMYKGEGTDISNYKLYDLLLNPHGCAYYRIINYKGVLYYIGTTGELYPDKHSADAQCKDGVYYIKLGFAEALI